MIPDPNSEQRRTRVLMLTKGLGRGGSERLLTGVARHIDRAQFRVEVAYLLPWKDAFVDEIAATGTPVHCLDGHHPTSVGWVRRLRHLVRDRDIDIVHTHMPVPAVAARLALTGRHRPALVHTEHNLWDRYRTPTRWANALTYRGNRGVIAVSDGVAASIRASLRAAVPVDVIVHGADLERVVTGAAARAHARRLLGLAPDTRVIGTVGNFTAKKDHATLLRALAAVAASPAGGDTTLVLVGTGPLEDELRGLAAELGVADRVVFFGSRGNVFDLLPALDVFALSSRFEGLPIALLEAMATGIAPVATSVGGIPEVITDGEDGLLVPPGDPAALASALDKALDDPALRADLGRRAQARAGAFDLVGAVRRTEDVYRRVLADGRGRQ